MLHTENQGHRKQISSGKAKKKSWLQVAREGVGARGGCAPSRRVKCEALGSRARLNYEIILILSLDTLIQYIIMIYTFELPLPTKHELNFECLPVCACVITII